MCGRSLSAPTTQESMREVARLDRIRCEALFVQYHRAPSRPECRIAQRTRPMTEWRILRASIIAAVLCAGMTALLWPALHTSEAGHHCLDFNWIWVTGKLAASHAAAQVYHPAPLPPEIAALD